MSDTITKEPGEISNEPFERGIFRKIVRENWKSKISGSTSNPKAAKLLDEHAIRMEGALGTIEYGALCMPNLISNSKNMSERELSAYLSALEAIGTGYKHRFNSEIAGILLAGLMLRARDPVSASKHLQNLTSSMEKKADYYGQLAAKENLSLEALATELKKKDSGIFRLFRRGEIAILKRLISMRASRSKRFVRKRERYSGIVLKVKGGSKR